MAFEVEPDCRYGHGKLVLVTEDGGAASILAAIRVDKPVNALDLGRAYEFNVYFCPICSYLELHDSEPKKK